MHGTAQQRFFDSLLSKLAKLVGHPYLILNLPIILLPITSAHAKHHAIDATINRSSVLITAQDLPTPLTTTPYFKGTTNQESGSIVEVKHANEEVLCSATVEPLNHHVSTWQCQSSIALEAGQHTLTASIYQQHVSFSVTINFDHDQDGIPSFLEQDHDSDKDGIPNFLDTDSDNDSILDHEEQYHLPPLAQVDLNHNGIDDAFDSFINNGVDNNNNGIIDSAELKDSDQDGTPNHLDNDSDNDKLADKLEGLIDSDNDGLYNFEDADSDNDGIPDLIEQKFIAALDLPSINNLAFDKARPFRDFDGDNKPDHLDLDADADGIPDFIEADNMLKTSGIDSDQDGIDNSYDIDQSQGVDRDGDGVDDTKQPRDTDLDLIPDYLDIDSDNDGIRDRFEGGALGIDANNNGIDDYYDVAQDYKPTALDHDGDQIPDYRDLDSDNDGRLDVNENQGTDHNGDGLSDTTALTSAPFNSDKLDEPDFRDLDSNNDGILDIVDQRHANKDNNLDGKLDEAYSYDSDQDGIPDIIDLNPHVFGSLPDADLDKVTNLLDLDSDNDGIPNTAEMIQGVPIDTDLDGIIDALDLDSDNDGIPDSIEAQSGFPDLDRDGRLDNFLDQDNDGLFDGIPNSFKPIDTDNDSLPDCRDLDSDNDSLGDLMEAQANGLISSRLDSNHDDMLDDNRDVDRDGMPDIVDPEQNGTPLAHPDTDNNGIPDNRQRDSDSDGIEDQLELTDSDNNGIIDNREHGGLLKTSTRGSGIGGGAINLAIALACFLTLIVVRHVRNKKKKRLISPLLTLVCIVVTSALITSPNAAAMCGYPISNGSQTSSQASDTFTSCWYLGAGYGNSLVNPESSSFGWSVSDQHSHGYKVFIGRRVSPHWMYELGYADLGSAELSQTNSTADSTAQLSYQVPYFMLGYLLRPPNRRLNLFAKLGISTTLHDISDTKILYERESSSQLAASAGLLWRINHRWFSRIEYDAFDRDAKLTTLSIGIHIGKSSTSAQLGDEATSKVTPTLLTDNKPPCSQPQYEMPIITFTPDSATLSPTAKSTLKQLAQQLHSTPHEWELHLHGFTDKTSSSNYTKILANRRAMTVKNYLINQQNIDSQLIQTFIQNNNLPQQKDNAPLRRVEIKRVHSDACTTQLIHPQTSTIEQEQ